MRLLGTVVEKGNRAIVIYSKIHGYKLVVINEPRSDIDVGSTVYVCGNPATVEYLKPDFAESKIDVLNAIDVLLV